ncbi:hypothetical protein ACS0TY_014004 [Phlomoides rotata]
MVLVSRHSPGINSMQTNLIFEDDNRLNVLELEDGKAEEERKRKRGKMIETESKGNDYMELHAISSDVNYVIIDTSNVTAGLEGWVIRLQLLRCVSLQELTSLMSFFCLKYWLLLFRLEEVRVLLNFPNCFSVGCIGRSGGLAFLWNNKVVCSLLLYSVNHVDMEVFEGSNHFIITSYYGHPERHRRQLSWNLLKQLSCVNSLPWIVIGDFNDILHNREKRGRVVHPLHLLRGFREAVNSCSIWDVELTGYPFMWSRCRGSPRFVEER